MADGREEKPLKRFAGAARRLNHQPELLRSVRRARERLLGGDQLVSGTVDVAILFTDLVGFPSWAAGGGRPVGAAAAARMSGWRRSRSTAIARSCGPASTSADRSLLRLDPSRNRRFRAKGVPKDVTVYSLSRAG